jgi:hypothetical protein
MKGASGTYSVGTLGLDIFYNMALSGGEIVTPFTVGGTYYAIAKGTDGQPFQTHWMRCLTDGDSPTFGLTVSIINTNKTAVAIGSELSTYIDLGELKNVSVVQPFVAPAIGELILISAAHGKWIGTRTGTPHLMGMEADNTSPSALLHVGMRRLTITGTRVSDGKDISYQNCTCIDASATAIFLQSWP